MVIPENSAEIMNFIPEHSTDSICVGDSATLCLTDYLEALEGDVAAKAPMSHFHGEYLSEDDAVAAFAMANHTHPGYLSEDDAVAAFSMADHTHTGYAPASHTHSDLVETMDALDTAIGGKAESVHTHAQADVIGLVEKLAEIDEAIEALQDAGGESGGAPAPMLTLSMHMGKLDNNNGAEVNSSTRICSDPFAVQNGQSYWQVNDNGVNMYVLLYDADEVFLQYLGSFASGAEIAVNNANAAYMRLGSLLGNYDLTNNFYIYDTDPAGSAVEEEEEAFTQADADLLYAPIAHTHDGFAPDSHTHTTTDITGMPYTEDSTYAGCHYRTVDGEQEWLNPPMALGTAYRTAERYNGKPVYVKRITLTKPASNNNDATIESADTDTGVVYAGTKMIDMSVVRLEPTERNVNLPFFSIHGDLVDWAFLYDAKPFLGASNNHVVRVYSKTSFRSNVYGDMVLECTLKYVKV